jgi:hypothetical protein
MINSNGNLTILVHVHYCCPICFEAPSVFSYIFDFAKVFVIFVTFRMLFLRKAKINLSPVIVFVFTLALVPLNPNPHSFVKPLKQKSLLRYLARHF